MTCRVCGVLTSSVNIPNKPHDLCVKHWMLEGGRHHDATVLDRIIADAKEQPEPSFLEADGPMGDPNYSESPNSSTGDPDRDLGVGQ